MGSKSLKSWAGRSMARVMGRGAPFDLFSDRLGERSERSPQVDGSCYA